MIDDLLAYVAPHHCLSCGKAGGLLCDNCKYYILDEPYGRCVACQKPTVSPASVCGGCKLPYQHAWCVSERTGELEQLINDFKFNNAKHAYQPLADLLHLSLPDLPAHTVIVPVPTVRSHVRQRGYDHTLLIANHLAKKRKLRVNTRLIRITNSKQRGAGRAERIRQAKNAFRCSTVLDSTVPYLLIDDVVTTGATIRFAAKQLRAAGAKIVWVAVVSRQPINTDHLFVS